jgi:hypothetical protein
VFCKGAGEDVAAGAGSDFCEDDQVCVLLAGDPCDLAAGTSW